MAGKSLAQLAGAGKPPEDTAFELGNKHWNLMGFEPRMDANRREFSDLHPRSFASIRG